MKWPTVTIEEACSLVTDGTHYTPPDVGHGVPFLTVKDMTDAGLDFKNCAHIDQAEYRKALRGNSAPHIGDVLFSKDGTVGKVHVVRGEEPFAVLSSIAILRPKPESLDSDYFGYVLKSSQMLEEALSRRTGSALRRIILKDLKGVGFLLPPLPEQKRIAAILAKADRLRRLRRYARDLSDTYLQSVFLEMFGDGERFKAAPLGTLLLGTPKNGLYLPADRYGSGTPIIRINNFYEGVLGNPERFKRVRATQQQIAEFAVVNGEILINRVNSLEYLGKCALVRGLTETTLFESNMMRLRVDAATVLPVYLVAFLTTQQADSQIVQRARKAVNQASINQQDVKSLMVPIPPMSLQQQFVHIVRRFERLRAQQREAERQAEHLFQTLLDRAFRGES